jgi:hypothetical protein
LRTSALDAILREMELDHGARGAMEFDHALEGNEFD